MVANNASIAASCERIWARSNPNAGRDLSVAESVQASDKASVSVHSSTAPLPQDSQQRKEASSSPPVPAVSNIAQDGQQAAENDKKSGGSGLSKRVLKRMEMDAELEAKRYADDQEYREKALQQGERLVAQFTSLVSMLVNGNRIPRDDHSETPIPRRRRLVVDDDADCGDGNYGGDNVDAESQLGENGAIFNDILQQ